MVFQLSGSREAIVSSLQLSTRRSSVAQSAGKDSGHGDVMCDVCHCVMSEVSTHSNPRHLTHPAWMDLSCAARGERKGPAMVG